MNRAVSNLIYTVMLVNGEKIEHIYNVPSKYDEAKQLVESMAGIIFNSLRGGGKVPLYLRNPTAIYNPANVLGVQFNAIYPEELEEAIRKAQRKIGFMRDEEK